MSLNYYSLKQLLVEYNHIQPEDFDKQVSDAKAINNVILIGKIKGETSRPSNLFDTVQIDKDSCFVVVDLFGFKSPMSLSSIVKSSVESFDNDDNFYMTKGDVVTVIRKSDLTDKICKIKGNIRLGHRVPSKAYLSLLNFYKVGITTDKKVNWSIQPCQVELARPNTLSDVMGTSAQYLSETIDAGEIKHPDYLDDMPKDTYNEAIISPNSVLTSFGQIKTDNDYSVQPATGFSVSRKQECRDTLKKPNQMYQKLQDKLTKAESDRANFLKELKNQYSLSDTPSDYVRYMFGSILYNMKRNQKYTSAMTGRTLIKRYLSNYEESKKKYMGHITLSEYVVDNFLSIKDYILGDKTTLDVSDSAYSLCTYAFGDYHQVYMAILGQIVGIPFEDIMDMVIRCNTYGIDIVNITTENPYLLQIFASVPFKTLDKLGLIFNKAIRPETEKYRNIALLNDYIMSSDNSNTLFTEDSLNNSNIGIKIGDKAYEMHKRMGTMYGDAQTKSIYTYINDKASLIYPDGYLQPRGGYYIEYIPKNKLVGIINDYTNTGIGIREGQYITSTTLCMKELSVADRLSELASKEYDYGTAEIDRLINDYEAIVGFKLEDRQRQAVHLLTHSAFIVTGGAGSGKTTVSNCIVYVLRHLEPDISIEFAAPTGKAAKRMQEVVQQQVSTLHSKFKIGLGDDDANVATSKNKTAYFFDEGAMISLDLMYSVLRRIDVETCRLFVFGDINQLPPIGKGLPFRNALDFMPCVYLNVSKRASEKSLITKNAKFIVESSDNNLESGDDFYIIPCDDNLIQGTVTLLCKYFLGKTSQEENETIKRIAKTTKLPTLNNLQPDDIQVVSPVTTPKYGWGCSKLNPELKKQFNPNVKPVDSFEYNDTVYSIGDRVIHVNKNCYNIQWYSSHHNGVYQKIWGKGICNGEVGKIVGIYQSNACTILDQIDPMPLEYDNKPVRDDDRRNDNYAYDVVVEFWDYISQQNFYIIYQAKLNTRKDGNMGKSLIGEDLNNLQLFYAGTTHKMQGSQAKVIICSLGAFNMRSNFISKEMLYTMVTRASDIVILVGSVSNDYTSTFSQGRNISAISNVVTIGEEIFKD